MVLRCNKPLQWIWEQKIRFFWLSIIDSARPKRRIWDDYHGTKNEESGYADDITYFFKTAEDEETSTIHLLSAHWKKTTSQTQKSSNIWVAELIIIILVLAHQNWKNRINSGNAAFQQHKYLLRNHHINLKTCTIFLNSYVRSKLTYCCQCWSATTETYNSLDRCYRLIWDGFKRIHQNNNDFRFQISNIQLHQIC